VNVNKVNYLKKYSKNIRKNILEMLFYSESGHPGSSLSIVEILSYLVVEAKVNFDKKSNILILSKGHAAPALYAVLIEQGYYSKEYLKLLRANNSPFQGHPDDRFTKEINFNSGSLGQNLSVALGMAYDMKKHNDNRHIFVIVGDGEMQEGQIWEAIMFASHHLLNNITLIIDYNKLQLDGHISEILDIYPLKEKMISFGWNVVDINGHDFWEFDNAFKKKFDNGKPMCVIANTIKGKGVSFMENVVEWHSLHISNSKKYLKKAIEELEDNFIEN